MHVVLCELSDIPVICKKMFFIRRIIKDALEFFGHVVGIDLDCTRDAMLLGADQITELFFGDVVGLHHICKIC
jgi:hypothetical protein